MEGFRMSQARNFVTDQCTGNSGRRVLLEPGQSVRCVFMQQHVIDIRRRDSGPPPIFRGRKFRCLQPAQASPISSLHPTFIPSHHLGSGLIHPTTNNPPRRQRFHHTPAADSLSSYFLTIPVIQALSLTDVYTLPARRVLYWTFWSWADDPVQPSPFLSLPPFPTPIEHSAPHPGVSSRVR
ncbi:hypothetical protein LX36DRAFT_149077 [Colletotrichum falcatum]|nr:hypothetical protein LX36DRAFT_149077 [Colletotrichum falcatum]